MKYRIETKNGLEGFFDSILQAVQYADKMIFKGYTEYNSFRVINEYWEEVYTTKQEVK